MAEPESKAIKLEEIRETFPTEPDRAEVEKRVIAATRANPAKLLREYRSFPDSANGRYVSADLMKEVFSDYAASRERRGRYNNIVHNSAAVLASAQFREAIQDRSDRKQIDALFITGIPGAGKTSAILTAGVPDIARIVYEGQLIDQSGQAKIAAAVEAGLKVKIVAVLPHIETALENTKKRFDNIGRGAAISTMAKIQEKTPDALTAIHERFGKQVVIEIADARDRANRRSLNYQNGVRLWKQENDRGSATERLNAHLDLMRRQGRSSPEFEQQARGQAAELGRNHRPGNEQARRSGRAIEDREASVLTASQGPDVSREQELARKFRNASQKERLSDPALKNAAKVLAFAYAHLDAAYKAGTSQNRRARSIVMDVMAANLAQGHVYEAPNIQRAIVRASGKTKDRGS